MAPPSTCGRPWTPPHVSSSDWTRPYMKTAEPEPCDRSRAEPTAQQLLEPPAFLRAAMPPKPAAEAPPPPTSPLRLSVTLPGEAKTEQQQQPPRDRVEVEAAAAALAALESYDTSRIPGSPLRHPAMAATLPGPAAVAAGLPPRRARIWEEDSSPSPGDASEAARAQRAARGRIGSRRPSDESVRADTPRGVDEERTTGPPDAPHGRLVPPPPFGCPMPPPPSAYGHSEAFPPSPFFPPAPFARPSYPPYPGSFPYAPPHGWFQPQPCEPAARPPAASEHQQQQQQTSPSDRKQKRGGESPSGPEAPRRESEPTAKRARRNAAGGDRRSPVHHPIEALPQVMAPHGSPPGSSTAYPSPFVIMKRHLHKVNNSFFSTDAYEAGLAPGQLLYVLTSEQRYRIGLFDRSDVARWVGARVTFCLRYAVTQAKVVSKKEGRSDPLSASRDMPLACFTTGPGIKGPNWCTDVSGVVNEDGELDTTFALAATSFLHGRRWFYIDFTVEPAPGRPAVRNTGIITCYVKARAAASAEARPAGDGGISLPPAPPPPPGYFDHVPIGPDAAAPQ
eukprot:tig00020801_g13971.t1